MNFKTKLILSFVIICFLFYTSFIIAVSIDNIKTINNNLNYSLINNLDKAGGYLKVRLSTAKQLFANTISYLDFGSYLDLSEYIAQPLNIVYKTISSPQTFVSNVSSGVTTIIQPVTETTKKVITEIISSADLLALQQKDEDIQKSLNDLSNNLNLISGKFSSGLSTAPNAPLTVGPSGFSVPSGNANLYSLGVNTDMGVARDLSVGGSTILGNDAADKVRIEAASTFNGPLTINASFTMASTSSMSLGKDLSVTGTTTLNDLLVSGNVGIATTSPYQQLSINGNLALTGALYDSTASAGTANYILKTTGSATQWVGTSTLFTAGIDSLPTGTGGQTLTYQGSAWTATSTLYISSAGNIGIGTSTPLSLLQISGTTPKFTLSDTSASADLKHWFIESNGGLFQIGTTSDALAVTATRALTINSSGNLGIGTTTPNWQLQVAGTRPFLVLSDTSAGTDTKHWFLSSQGGNFYIGTSTDALSATTTYLTIVNNGSVGIGTVNPLYRLDVNGSIRTSAIGPTLIVDGVVYTQSGAGIQKAINALPASGGEVYLPAGTYLTNGNEINITKNNVTLKGAGKDTEIVNTGTSGEHAIKITGSASGFIYNTTIKDLTIKAKGGFCTIDSSTDIITATAHGLSNGQRVKIYSSATIPGGIVATQFYYIINATTNTFQISGTLGGAAVNITSDGIDVGYALYGGGNGINADYTQYSIFENLALKANGTNGLYITNGKNGNRIVSSDISFNGNDGIYNAGTYGLIVADCSFRDNTVDHIYFSYGYNSIITDSTFLYSRRYTIYLMNTYHTLVTGCHIETPTQEAIYIDQTGVNGGFNTFTGNMINYSESPYPRMTISDDSPNNQIVGNKFSGNGGELSIAGDYTLVSGNTFDDNGLDGYRSEGIHLTSTASNNLVTDNHFFHSNNYSIKVEGGYNTIRGNFVVDQESGGSPGAEIILSGASALYNIVDSNKVVDTRSQVAYGILVYNSSDYNRITNNVVYGFTTAQISLATTHNEDRGNSRAVDDMSYTILNGNVGIGTTSPQSLLDISGSSNSTSYTTFDGTRSLSLVNTNTTNNNANFLAFRTLDANGVLTTGAKIGGIYTSHSAGAVSGELGFFTNNAGAIGERMRLTATGNVGIGTTTPLNILSIRTGGNTAAASPSVLFSASSTAAMWTSNWIMGADLADAGKFKIASSTALGTNDILTIDGNGKVGIGATAPLANLYVYQANPTANQSLFRLGTSDDNARFYVDEDGDVYNDGMIVVTQYVNTQGGAIYDDDGSLYVMGEDNLYLKMDYNNDATTQAIVFAKDTSLLIVPTAANELMRIQESGLVGIGTTSPFAILSLSNSASTAVNTPLFVIASTTAGVSTSTLLMVNANGDVGIGTTTPAMKFSVQGDALADSWNTYSDIYVGDALTKLKGIKAVDGQTGDWVEVEHSSLPEGILNEIGGQQFMSVSNLTLMNTRAIMQLEERIKMLEDAAGQLSELGTLPEGETPAEESILSVVSASLKNLLAGLSGTVRTAGEWVFEKLTTKNIQVEQGVTIKDQSTGEYYCVTLQNGEIVKTSGKCGE